MAKKNRVIADKVRNRKIDVHKKTNPFEVKINRQKHEILGRKIAKHDRGQPGVSRSKAIKRRKETLLHEYKQRFKSNQLVDRRLGENDPNLSVEEKMLQRYAIERERSGGGNKFNLNDDEELTHYGQSLSEIEKFDDPDISDDEEDAGKIEGDMVAKEHFGGFLTRKDPSDAGDKKSWKEKMEEVIAKSKKAKYERQSEKEKSAEMTEQLDEQWRDIAELLGGMMGRSSKAETKPVSDEYDITVRELKYEMKGKATDRLKTEEELAKDEKERLEKLEADRVRRMKGIVTGREQHPQQHRSADSLDDGLALRKDDTERLKMTFRDGHLVRDDEEEKGDNSDEEKSDEAEGDDEDNDNSDEDGDVDKDGDEEEDGNIGDVDDEGDVKSDGDNDTDGEGDESDDSYADIVSDSDGEEEQEEKGEKTVSKTKVKSILKKMPETKEEKKKKHEIKKAAEKELPYTFEAPDSYDILLDLLHGRSEIDQLIIIERIRKCHHSSLAEGNKAKMETLLRLLVQYYGSVAVQEVPALSLLDKLTRHIYDLTQQSPGVAAQVIQRILQNQQADFIQMRERKRPVLFTLDILLYLKLVSVLFPTSDFSHPVTTPAMLFMGQLLSQSPVNTERDVACGLFLCNLFLEYTMESKRFVPEVISFLHGVLFLAANKDDNKVERVFGPFKPVGKAINLLHMTDKKSKACNIEPMKLSQVFGVAVERTDLSTPSFRLTLIQCAVNLLHEFSKLYVDLPAYQEIFSTVLYMSSKLPTLGYPQQLKESVKKLVSHLTENRITKHSLVFNKAKPKSLQMFEPQIEESWDGKRKKGGSNKAYNEKQKLVHKVKKEMKGAMREIRKDTQFLARHQQQETMQKDADRKRKVKALYGHLANQEGDYKGLKRKKKK